VLLAMEVVKKVCK